MTRKHAREIAVHMIFALGFGNRDAEELLGTEFTRGRFAQLKEEVPLYQSYPNQNQALYIRSLVQGVFLHGPELDDYISRYAVGWSFARIPRMAAAVMRTAMYEVLYMPDVPNAAAIDAAVELAKGYEPPKVVSFINGILGTFVRKETQQSSDGPFTGERENPEEEEGELDGLGL